MQIEFPSSGYLKIKVIPKSQKTEFQETFEDSEGILVHKIRIKAVPEKGKANEELIRFLSKELSIPKYNIEIISGATSKIKLIRVKP